MPVFLFTDTNPNLVWSFVGMHRNGGLHHRMDKRAAETKIANKKHHYATMMTASSAMQPSADGRCMARVQSAIGDMMSSATTTTSSKNGNRRHTTPPLSTSLPGVMDLSGYALHQRLRTAPGAEMYVTRMRAKVMPASRDGASAEPWTAASGNTPGNRFWAQVDECRYDPLGNTLEARMRFGRTLMVSGSVRLLYGGGNRAEPVDRMSAGETGCDMTLRLRPRAGLGFTAVPLTMPEKSPPNRLTATPTMTIRTTATFIDPEPAADDPAGAYVSVHSYNCVGGAAGFPGLREQPAAYSDRFEQFMSAEDGVGDNGSDELLSGGSGAGNVEFDIDMNDDGSAESTESGGDRRSSNTSRRPSSSSTSKVSPSSPPPSPDAPAPKPFNSAGFVAPAAHSPEPRLRRIQYRPNTPTQHPLLTVAAAVSNHHQPTTQDQLLMEMEDVFVRGVRSLLAKHMERTLKPVLKDSLMANMGYTVSYG